MEGEEKIVRLCDRFRFPKGGIVREFREFCDNPRARKDMIKELLIGIANYTIAISSAEAERRFSAMNLVLTPLRNAMTIQNLLSPLH